MAEATTAPITAPLPSPAAAGAARAPASGALMISLKSFSRKLFGHADIMFAVGIMGILMVLLFPVPTIMLDILLGISISISVIILMTSLFINKPLDFSVFPTVLLISTILRLALNIASTRLILTHGHTGPAAAGHVIQAFGGFVMEGSVVIGAIIFIILTIINFVVITKGSGRIAEVSARFSLDAMPGKQMAIDADLSAGLIDEATAKSRRKELEDESTFFGAMDGASKFVRGDAIAGLLITAINLIAGIIIGVVQRDMNFGSAVETYTILTIGDGLVSQIPALVISTAAGLLVSKSGVTGSADKAIFKQLGNFPQALGICSGLLIAMSLMPGIPASIFLPLALLVGGTAWLLWKAQKVAAETATMPPSGSGATPGTAGAAEGKPEEESIGQTLHIDALRLELGYGLLPLINYQKGHRLTEQIKALRKQMARDFGFVLPSVRIQDNLQLPTNTYIVKVKEIECARGEVRPDMLLVMSPSGQMIDLPGEDTRDPAFGLPAKWISDNLREEASFRNFTVVDPPTVITTHLTEIIKENITYLLSYTETQKLLDELSDDHKKLLTDIIPSQLSVSGIQRVLQNLLAEMISIRDLPTILESVAEGCKSTQNPTMLTEHVRMRLNRQISHMNTNDQGYIPVLVLSPRWEQLFNEALSGSGDDKHLRIAPSQLQEFIAEARKRYDMLAMQGEMPVLLTSAGLRPHIRSIIERFRPSTVVMSQNEIHPKTRVKTLGQV